MNGKEAAVPEAGVWWVAASGTAGFGAGLMLGVPWRQQLFMAVLLAGVCGLVLVYRGWIKDGAHVSVSSTTAIANELPVSSQVADLMAHDELLSPEAAREWLDWLLRQQQI